VTADWTGEGAVGKFRRQIHGNSRIDRVFGTLARAEFWKSMAQRPALARTGAIIKPRTKLLGVETFIRRRLAPVEVATDAAGAGHLIAALEAAAAYDIFWSNEHFYRWLEHDPEKWVPVFGKRSCSNKNLERDDDSKKSHPDLSPAAAPPAAVRPIMAMDRRFTVRLADRVEPAAKLAFLRRLATDGRFPGAAVAHGRWLAKSGDLEPALALVRQARDASRRIVGPFGGLHILDNQITALERMIAGKPVHHALRRYLGDDDGHMAARTCTFPFERMDIHENGNASVCCSHWTPYFSLGNVMAEGKAASEIFNSESAVAMRESVLDGSFRFCDHVKCPWIAGDTLPRKQDARGPNARRALDSGELRFERPRYVFLAFDASCNLSCPSCRLRVITEKANIQIEKEELIESSIMPLLKDVDRLNLNAAGELLVSRPLRRLLSKLNRRDFPNLKIEIITNGTLFTPREWAKFPGIHDMVDSIRVSTDGASKPTFELLRRGARWEPFMENMRFLASLSENKVINLLLFSMTYQVENFREMPAFVDMCRALHPSAWVIFEKLENWGTFSAAEYARKAVHLMSHPLHEEFLSVIRQPKLAPSNVLLTADYAGLL
jgi:wyosine [tRNA(Phe)-imidazoG37] synthetase (radical SAM superfamily)